MKFLTTRNKSIVLCVLFFIVILQCGFFFGNDPVKIVQKGVLELDNSTTVGDALNGYKFFKSTKWESFIGDQNRKVVQFTGVFDLEKVLNKSVRDDIKTLLEYGYMTEAKSPVNTDKYVFTAQFILQNDEEKFRVGYVGYEIDGIEVDANAHDFNMIYTNQFLEANEKVYELCGNYVYLRIMEDFKNGTIGEYKGTTYKTYDDVDGKHVELTINSYVKIININENEMTCDVSIKTNHNGIENLFEIKNQKLAGKTRMSFKQISPVYIYSNENTQLTIHTFNLPEIDTFRFYVSGFRLEFNHTLSDINPNVHTDMSKLTIAERRKLAEQLREQRQEPTHIREHIQMGKI